MNSESLYTQDTVYRPPLEKDSMLLEVSRGCSYRRCLFCDFARDEYDVLPLEHIRSNAEKLGQQDPLNPTLFLLGQNVMHLPTPMLLSIMDYVHEFMPHVNEINAYARVDDILKKGEEDLLRLAAAGLHTLHVGLESGSDEVLNLMQKGVSAQETLRALHMLSSVGLHYNVTYILGLGGRSLWREHVAGTAELLSQLIPISIWALALKIWPQTPLAALEQQGAFAPLSYAEMLMEERLIIEGLNMPQLCLYMDTTVLGTHTVAGVLPDGKESILRSIDGFLTGQDLGQFLYE